MDQQSNTIKTRIHHALAKQAHRKGILDKAAYHYARAAQHAGSENTRQTCIDAYWQVQSMATPLAIQVMEGPALIRRLPVHPAMTSLEVWREAMTIAGRGFPTGVETRCGVAELTRRGRLKWSPSVPGELMMSPHAVDEGFESEEVV